MKNYLSMQASLQPNRLAARDFSSGRSWTYQAFSLAAAQYAALLVRYGIGQGGRVAALAKNRLVLLHLACAQIGAMYVPLNWRLAAAEIAALIADAEPGLILGDSLLAGAGIDGMSLDDFAAEAVTLEPWGEGAANDEDPSLILYTSGTSGKPKGVLLSERNIWQTARNFSLLGRVTHQSAVLCDSPMFHVIGLVTNIRPVLMRGGAFLVAEGFPASRTGARLADPALAVTHYFCVPQMAAMLRADPAFDPEKLRGLTAIFSGGAPMAADAIRAWTKDGIALANGFGMTENGTVSCMPLDLELIASRPGAAGIIPPGIEARILPASFTLKAPTSPPVTGAGRWRQRTPLRRMAGSAAGISAGSMRMGISGLSTARRTCSSPEVKMCIRRKLRARWRFTRILPNAPLSVCQMSAGGRWGICSWSRKGWSRCLNSLPISNPALPAIKFPSTLPSWTRCPETALASFLRRRCVSRLARKSDQLLNVDNHCI